MDNYAERRSASFTAIVHVTYSELQKEIPVNNMAPDDMPVPGCQFMRIGSAPLSHVDNQFNRIFILASPP